MTKYIGVAVATLLWFLTVNPILRTINMQTFSFSNRQLLFATDMIFSWIVAVVIYFILFKLVEYITSSTITYKQKKSAR